MRMAQAKHIKGFTLVEIIVVISIIAVLAAILVPAMVGFVRRANIKSDIAHAKKIYTDVLTLLVTDDELNSAFYAYTTSNVSKDKITVHTSGGTEHYKLTIVTYMDGTRHNDQQWYTWSGCSNEEGDFQTALNDMYGNTGKNASDYRSISVPMKAKHMDFNGKRYNVTRWFIGYRTDNKDQIEIWAGIPDKSVNWDEKAIFRLYPDPCLEYDNGT